MIQDRYASNVLTQNILPERNVKLFVTEYDELRRELIRRNWHRTLTNLMEGSIDMALVKEFYVNLYDPEDKSPRQVQVRGKLIKFDGETLNAFLETPPIIQPGEWSRPDPQDPTINLAYIKKNCWNLDDPSVTFLGTRKARARESKGPSSSAPPASTAPAPLPPSAPAHTDTSAQSPDIIMSMLQSLHHGLYLVMQSIHALAQHRPIMSMEESLTFFFWGGEASATQKSQPELEATQEDDLDVVEADPVM
ncbi:hypothetical protein HKD37_17G048784 [Glycine soja]